MCNNMFQKQGERRLAHKPTDVNVVIVSDYKLDAREHITTETFYRFLILDILKEYPKVLYLDEPTIGLDLVVKDNIRQAIKEINEKYGTTVILTTHDIGDIEELCSRIIIIDEGKKIYDGSLEKLKDTYGTRRKVSMEVKHVKKVKELQLAEKLGVQEEDLECSLDEVKKVLTVSFDKHKIQVPQVMNEVMKVTEVQDVQIQETELAEIVKAIYNHGV